MILAGMSKSLSRGRRIEVRELSAFSLRYRPPRVERTPKSGDKVKIPGKSVPFFKAGGELREQVSAGKLGPGGDFRF